MLPTVAIFSDPNFLTEHLIEALLSKQCQIIIFTEDTTTWSKVVKDFENRERIKIHNRDKSLKDEVDYTLLVSGFSGETKAEEREILQDTINFMDDRRTKSLFVLPFAKREAFESLLARNETRRVYLGEIYGQGMDIDKNGTLNKILVETIIEERVEIPGKDSDLLTIFVDDAVNDIVRSLFSYGFSGKSVLMSEKTTYYKLLGDIQKILPEVIFYQGQKVHESSDLRGITFVEPRSKSKDSLKETLTWLKENKKLITKEEEKSHVTSIAQEKQVNIPKPNHESRPEHKKRGKLKISINKKFYMFSLAGLFIFLLSPFIFLAVSLVSLKFSFDSFIVGKTKTGETFISVSNFASSASLEISNVLVPIPLLGSPYVFATDMSMLAKEGAIIGRRGSETMKQVKALVTNIFNDTDYDVTESSRVLAVNLQLLYQDSSFLQSEIDKIGGLSKKISSQNIDLDKIRQIFLNSQAIAKGLPQLLGVEKPRTYMILFQNSMELRPTGGFIGSFALATFNKGKLSNIEFFDVYTADGQLKGHVEPPAPIKNYLGEANWYLRDSNWDPDFKISSERAEWFLDKELDRSVDGVIGIDLEVPESFLKDTGPVRLADFNQEIDYKNLYEKIQYEVESKFFPGSQNKTNILTSLGQAIITKFKESKDLPFEKLGKSTYANLEGRHIQLFMHDADVNKAISQLGWGGEVQIPPCGSQNCSTVLAGLVEANVGVNKSNYFVARNISFTSFVNAGTIENTLTVELKNSAPSALGVSGRYKDYIRVITNPDSKVKQVGIIEAGGTKALTPETTTTNGRLEIGALVDVAPGSKKSVRFTWSIPAKLDFAVNGQVVYLIRKQAGVGADPLTVKINPPSGVDFLGKTSYNTNLDKDQLITLSW